MTAPTEPMDGGLAIDPRVARVLLRYREAITQATEKAYRDLMRLGYWSPGDDPLPPPSQWLWGKPGDAA